MAAEPRSEVLSLDVIPLFSGEKCLAGTVLVPTLAVDSERDSGAESRSEAKRAGPTGAEAAEVVFVHGYASAISRNLAEYAKLSAASIRVWRGGIRIPPGPFCGRLQRVRGEEEVDELLTPASLGSCASDLLLWYHRRHSETVR